MVESKKKCPICGGQMLVTGKFMNSVGVVSRHYSGPDVKASCDDCGYVFNMSWLEVAPMFLMFVLMFTFPFILIFSKSIWVFFIMFPLIFLLPWFLLYRFVKSDDMKDYYRKRIVKKAYKMVEKGKKKDWWTGDRINDLEHMRVLLKE